MDQVKKTGRPSDNLEGHPIFDYQSGSGLFLALVAVSFASILIGVVAQKSGHWLHESAVARVYSSRDAAADRFQKIFKSRGVEILSASRANCSTLSLCMNDPGNCTNLLTRPDNNTGPLTQFRAGLATPERRVRMVPTIFQIARYFTRVLFI